MTEKGREVDFIVRAPKSGSPCLIQACWSLADAGTRLRETTALTEAMREKKVKRGLIVTAFDEKHDDDLPAGVSAVSAWRWLLSEDPFLNID